MQTIEMQVEQYTLDLASGLTQVLSDGAHTYLYGNGRISQYTGTIAEYFLGDALGSVRQLADASGNVTLAKGYEPYGEVLGSVGNASTAYGFTGEWTDDTGMVYLRARYYDPTIARFMTKDTWGGNINQPISYNAWLYVHAYPINYSDPTGRFPVWCQFAPNGAVYEACVLAYYQLEPISYSSLGSNIEGSRGCYEGKIDYRAPGYLEGIGGFVPPLLSDYIVQTWGGNEIVYDFATMESEKFSYTGPGISDALMGGGIVLYNGAILGFRSDTDIVRDYAGPFRVIQFGLSFDVFVGIGIGLSGFRSTSDPLIQGGTWYVGGSLSAYDWLEGIDIGGAYLL